MRDDRETTVNTEKEKKIRVGSRESILAVAQSKMVIEYIKQTHPEVNVELVTMKTTGDKILDRRLDQVGGKGLFVKELDAALRDRRADITVHSLKDMPMEVADDLPLVAYSKREDPRDVLVLPVGQLELDRSLPIGTSSMRRALQLKKIFPDVQIKSIRGNVQTRLKKLDSGEFGAIVLAGAGLRRLGLEMRISRYFSPEEMIPAAGQGIIAVQGRAGEQYAYLDGYTSRASAMAAAAERAYVAKLNGGCSSPIAAHARIDGKIIQLIALYYDEKTDIWRTGHSSCEAETIKDAKRLGEELAMSLSNC